MKYFDKNYHKAVIRQTIFRGGVVICLLTSVNESQAAHYSFHSSHLQNLQQEKQSHLITGTITDNKGVPLPGVTIRYGNTGMGTATDNDGAFVFHLPEASGQLMFSCVGFKTISMPYTVGQPINVRMEEDINELTEVTVVGYGKQRKDEVSGSVSALKADKLQNKTSASFLSLAQGQLAGVNIMQGTGDPSGRNTEIYIRGMSDLSIGGSNRKPLFVIDGVIAAEETNLQTGGNALSALNPNDIETLTVLKDAAAASIYGSRAANGVVIITTKQGQYNQKARVSANVSHAIIFSPSLPNRIGGNAERRYRLQAMQNYQNVYLDLTTGTYKYPSSYEESYLNGGDYNYFWNKGEGASMSVYQDSLNSFYNNSTDLFKYYFNTAHATNANLQIQGGSPSIAYSVGLGFYDEKGTLRNTGYRRLSAYSNLGFKPNPKLSGNLKIYLAYQNNNRAGKGVDMFNTADVYQYTKIPDFLLSTSTVLPGPGTAAFDELTRRYEQTKEKNDSYKLRTAFDLAYKITPGLELKSSVAAEYNQTNLNVFLPANIDQYGETYSSGQIARHLMLLNENLLSYSRTFNDTHSVDALVGFSVQSDENNNLGGYGKKAASELIHYVPWYGNVYDSENDRPLKEFNSDFEKSTMVGLFGRLNYNYKQKYYAGATLRRDASSRFGENVRWGVFPSYFLAWNFTKENFMQWAENFMNYGKLRFSYGKSGRIFKFPYVAYGELQPSQPFMGNPTVTPEWFSGLMNRELTWEETRQYDVGLDMNFLNNRLAVIFDYYYKYTDKLLYNIKLPGTHSGYDRQWQNAYAISNEGVELEIRADLIRTDKLTWDISFNIASNWNKLEKSTNKRDFQNFDARFSNNISVIGKPLNGIYAYKDGGIYQSQDEVPYYWQNGKKQYLSGSGNAYYRPGDRIIYDADGNGKIYSYVSLAEDRVYIGSPLPKFQGGFTTNLTYKGFDLNLLFNFVGSRWIINTGKGSSLETSLGLNANDMARPYFVEDLDKIDFWQKPGDNTDYAANRLNVGLLNFATNIASNAQKVSYLKLKAATIGYTLPESIQKRLGISARIFVTGENLFTLTNYKGADPESVDVATGVDELNNYPLSKRVTIGLTLDF